MKTFPMDASRRQYDDLKIAAFVFRNIALMSMGLFFAIALVFLVVDNQNPLKALGYALVGAGFGVLGVIVWLVLTILSNKAGRKYNAQLDTFFDHLSQ